MRLMGLIACLGICAVTGIIRADEPAEQFLEQLREMGYYDTANEWLDAMQSSPLASDEFRKKIKLEKAKTIIAELGNMRSYEELETRTMQADTLLEEYTASISDPDLKTDADIQRANLLILRATAFSRQTKSDRITANERNELNTKITGILEQAKGIFETAKQRVRDRAKNLVIDPDDPESKAERDRLARKYAELEFKTPVVKELLAETYGPNSPQYKPLLEEAAKEFVDLFDEYKNFYGGWYCLDAARCYEKVGKYDDAISMLSMAFEIATNEQTIDFKRDAGTIAIKCWAHQDPYPHQQVIEYFEPLFNVPDVARSRDPKWLMIKLELAKAFRAQAVAFDNNANPTQEMKRQANIANRRARSLARSLLAASGEPRDKAIKLLEEWNIKIIDEPDETKEPENLEEARKFGVDALGEAKIYAESVELELEQIEQQLSQPGLTQQQKDDLLAKKQPIMQELETKMGKALEFFEKAESLAGPGTATVLMNQLRFYKCECYYRMRKFYETAIIGRFMLERYPDEKWTSEAVQYMTRAYWFLYIDAPEDNREWERQQLAEATERTLSLYGGSPQADEACRFMLLISQVESDVNGAKKYAQLINTDSPIRAKGEVWIGQSIRDGRLREKIAVRQSDQQPTEQQLDQWKQLDSEALQYLTDGLGRIISKDDIDTAVVRGAITRIEILLEQNNVDDAIKQLEQATIAPLDLAKEKHPSLEGQDRLQRDIYRVATRTYLAAMRTSKEPDQWTQKADGVIEALRQSMINEPDGNKKLIAVYVQLANQLKEQLNGIDDPAQRKIFATSLITVIGKIRDDAKNTVTLVWSAGVLGEVADLLDNDKQTTDAQKLYKEADEILDKAEQVSQTEKDVKETIKVEIKRRKALMQRGLGNYQKAIGILADILQKDQKNVLAQIDAATTYQMWGKSSGDVNYYARAMAGGEFREVEGSRRPKKVIWGWQTLCAATVRNDALKEVYYRSLRNLVECWIEYGDLKGEEKAIRNGMVEIRNQYKRDPSLGGDQWKPEFEKLAKRIQKELGENQIGLQEIMK